MPENPPAFPIPIHSRDCKCPCGNVGMTMRDYYAGQALIGLIVCPNLKMFLGENLLQVSEKNLAISAYTLADALLIERAKNNQDKKEV